ncbi:MAG: DUF3667 domain-containing protein [Burkholderiales bacterium]|nr:DUF3667 domain-containing protein [Burkholderiales bacterium]
MTLRNIAAQLPRQRGLLHTLAGLARRPGQVILRYLDGHRVEFANPLNLLTLTAGFAALLYTNHRFDLTPLLAGLAPDTLATQSRLLNFQFKYRTLLQVLDLPLLAAITWLLFRGRGRGYAEHLVINAYSMSAVNILYLLLFVVLLGVDGTPAFRIAWVVGSVVPFAYKAGVLYAVFAGTGRRWRAALLALAATAFAVGLQIALMTAIATWAIAPI